jgi:hypothetical protein
MWLPAAGGDGAWADRMGSGLMLMRGDIFEFLFLKEQIKDIIICIARWRGRLLTTGHLIRKKHE